MDYTVTIRPNEGPVLVVELEVVQGAALVRSISAQATNGTGITTMPAVNFAALAQALTETAPTSARAHSTDTGLSVTKKPAAKSRTRKAATPENGNGKRPYRKAPPDDELLAVHQQAGGSVPAIADAFKVPPRTVYAWLKSARARGALPKARDAKSADEAADGAG